MLNMGKKSQNQRWNHMLADSIGICTEGRKLRFNVGEWGKGE